jgi:hypothetical protein
MQALQVGAHPQCRLPLHHATLQRMHTKAHATLQRMPHHSACNTAGPTWNVPRPPVMVCMPWYSRDSPKSATFTQPSPSTSRLPLFRSLQTETQPGTHTIVSSVATLPFQLYTACVYAWHSAYGCSSVQVRQSHAAGHASLISHSCNTRRVVKTRPAPAEPLQKPQSTATSREQRRFASYHSHTANAAHLCRTELACKCSMPRAAPSSIATTSAQDR